MKRQTLAMIGAAGLLLAFAGATWLYQSRKAAEAESAVYDAAPYVRDHSPVLGSDRARVSIVEFFDPGCETCSAFAAPVKKIVEEHDGKVKLVLRYVPFHQGADTVALALEASRRQGKFWETLDLVFEKQPEWADHHHPRPDALWQHFPSVGLDVEKLRADMGSAEVQAVVRQDMADAVVLGVRKTPTFLVNGRPLERFGLAQLQTLVNDTVAEVYGR